MSVTQGLGTTLNIISQAASVLDSDVAKKVARAGAAVDRVNQVGGAITAFSAQTTILSRSFVDEAIIDEAIMPNLFRSIHEWYAAQIIAALHLSRMVDGQRTVQDVMSVIQTGHNARERSLLGNVVARYAGQESFLCNLLGEAALESSDPADPFVLVTRQQLDDLERDREHHKNSSKESMSVKSVNTSDNRIGPMGELFEVKLTNPNGNGQTVAVPVFIQMQPSIVPADIAPRFVDMNVAPTVWQRWTQMRSGELTFWKDFLFQRDLIRRQKSILKDRNKSEAFSSFLRTIANKDTYALADASDKVGSRMSSNLANSVIVLSEDTVARAKADSGIDLHNPRDRMRYFHDTYSMIVVIVDPLHQRVTIYFNGLEGDINSSYNDFRPKDAKFDPKDFMAALQAFSTNNIGRLR